MGSANTQIFIYHAINFVIALLKAEKPIVSKLIFFSFSKRMGKLSKVVKSDYFSKTTFLLSSIVGLLTFNKFLVALVGNKRKKISI